MYTGDIVVIGDVLIDEYIVGSTNRVSPEAPVPVVNEQERFRRMGGAANVFRIIRENASSNVYLIGGFSNSDQEFFGKGAFNCFPSHTNIKTRIVSNDQQIVRVDKETKHNVAFYDIKEVLDDIDLNSIGLVVLSDYNKGVLQQGDTQKLIEYLSIYGIPVFVDTKDKFSKYKGAHVIKANEKEFVDYFEPVSSYYIQTLGKNGCKLFTDDSLQVVKDYESEKVNVSDVTGAGDTFLAFLAIYFNEQWDINHAIEMANKAAGLSVQHLGNHLVKRKDLEPRIIFTNGCFDILHLGHISLLNYAQSLGDRLVVGLNSDSSVRRLKGENRPVNDQKTRKRMLELLGFEVHIFDEDTPYNLIKKINPHVIVKGGDYDVSEVVGRDLAEVKLFEYVEDFSTTNIIEKIKK